MVRDTTAEDFCKTISNFSLEYRTTRQAILLQRERERQKSGAESPGPNTPAARRKRQQTPTQVFVFQMLLKWSTILDNMIDWLCLHARFWSSRKMRSNVGWRRCWRHLSPPQDWTSLCLETAGGWSTSKVLTRAWTKTSLDLFFCLSLSMKCVVLNPYLFTSQVHSHGKWSGDPADPATQSLVY